MHKKAPIDELYLIAADSYIALRDFASAEICLWRALSLEQSSIKILSNLANITLIRRDLHTTAHLISRLEALNPDFDLLQPLKKSFQQVVSLNKSPLPNKPFSSPMHG